MTTALQVGRVLNAALRIADNLIEIEVKKYVGLCVLWTSYSFKVSLQNKCSHVGTYLTQALHFKKKEVID